jgi:hypothetical protein
MSSSRVGCISAVIRVAGNRGLISVRRGHGSVDGRGVQR